MTYLLDTHIILWWLEDSPELKPEIKSHILNPSNKILISTGSLWEINIKISIGKLRIDNSYADILASNDLDIISINKSHVMKVLELPDIHNDPFDRILIAQAMTEDAVLISRDKKIAEYPVNFLSA